MCGDKPEPGDRYLKRCPKARWFSLFTAGKGQLAAAVRGKPPRRHHPSGDARGGSGKAELKKNAAVSYYVSSPIAAESTGSTGGDEIKLHAVYIP